METSQSHSQSPSSHNQTSFKKQCITLPTNIKKNDITQEIESLCILEKRTHRISRETSSSETLTNPEYFEGAEADNYKEQLANDVLMLINFVHQSINDPVAHLKLIDDTRNNSVKFKGNKLKFILGRSSRLLVHDAPIDLYYGNEHILKLLNKHHYCTLGTTAVACIFNTGYFGALVPTNNLMVSNTVGFGIGALVMGGTQVIFKDTIIENTRLSESELKPGVEHVRERNPLRRNQPPQDFDIKHFGKIARVKRFWLAAGFTTGIAVLSGFNHMTHLDSSAIDELYRYERDKIAKVINTEAERESKDFQEYKTILRRLEKDSSNGTLKDRKNELEVNNAVLGSYDQQLKNDEKLKKCNADLDNLKKKEKNIGYRADELCNDYITNGHKQDQGVLSAQIESFGGTYRDGQIPTGPKVNNRIKFEKNATGDSLSEILQNYYKEKGQLTKFDKLKAMIEGGEFFEKGKFSKYERGHYFNEMIDSKTRYEIGMKRFWRDIAQSGFPNGLTQAILIFLIEMLSLGTSAIVMGDRTYRFIVLNANVQNFSQEYLHDLVDIICSLSERVNSQTEFRPEFNEHENIRLTKDEVFEIAKKQSQNGKLTGLGSIISTHVNLIFENPYDQQAQHTNQAYNNIRDIPTQSLDLQSKFMEYEIDCLTEILNEKDAKLRDKVAQRNFREGIAEQNRKSEILKNQSRNEIAEQEEISRTEEERSYREKVHKATIKTRSEYDAAMATHSERHGGENFVIKLSRFWDRFRSNEKKKFTYEKLMQNDQSVPKSQTISNNGDDIRPKPQRVNPEQQNQNKQNTPASSTNDVSVSRPQTDSEDNDP
jgi:hypothetical protein